MHRSIEKAAPEPAFRGGKEKKNCFNNIIAEQERKCKVKDPCGWFDQWDAENTRWRNSRPVCGWCGQPITEDHMYIVDLCSVHRNMCECCFNDHVDRVEIYDD